MGWGQEILTTKALFFDWLAVNLVVPARSMKRDDVFFAAIVGFWGGIFPIPGASTLATLGIAALVKCSPPQASVAVAVNILVMPVQIFLMPLFMMLPNTIFHGLSHCGVSKFLESFKSMTFVKLLESFGVCMLRGICAWVMLAVVFIAIFRAAISTFNTYRLGHVDSSGDDWRKLKSRYDPLSTDDEIPMI